MSESTIGIKIANGTFFPILEENAVGKKKLVLTTVNDNQTSVQIDLYRGTDPEIGHDSYLGSLVIENVPEAPRGEPEIELLLGVDDEGKVNAIASELQTGEQQTLSVSLQAISEGNLYDVPDFELDEQFKPDFDETEDTDFGPSDLSEDEFDMGGDEEQPGEEAFGPAYDETIQEEEYSETEQTRRVHPVLLVGFILLGLLIVVLIAFLLFRSFQGPAVPPLETARTGGTEVLITAAEQEESRIGRTEQRDRQEDKPEGHAESAEKKTAETAAETGITQENGVWYTIRWGDTLWDISQSFYRTPWLYKKIAARNNIKNPDLIFAGTKIFIPER